MYGGTIRWLFLQRCQIFLPADLRIKPPFRREGRLFGLFGDGVGQYDLGVGFPAFGDGGDAGLLDLPNDRQLFHLPPAAAEEVIRFFCCSRYPILSAIMMYLPELICGVPVIETEMLHAYSAEISSCCCPAYSRRLETSQSKSFPSAVVYRLAHEVTVGAMFPFHGAGIAG